MTPEMEEVRNAGIGMLNGCGIGSILWLAILCWWLW